MADPPGREPAVDHRRMDTSGRGGLAWQAAAAAHHIAEGRTDSPVHSLDDAISVMRTIDIVRAQANESR